MAVYEVIPPYAGYLWTNTSGTRYPLTATQWRGQSFNNPNPFRAVSFFFYRYYGAAATVRFELRSGQSATSPLVHSEVVSVPVDSDKIEVKIDLPKIQAAGAYHFRIYPVSGPYIDLIGHSNTSYSTGQALYGSLTGGTAYGTDGSNDLQFRITNDLGLGEYFGNDEYSTSRSVIAPGYMGMEFSTARPVNAIHFMLTYSGQNRAYRLEVRRGYGVNAPVVYDSGNVVLPYLAASSVRWVSQELPQVLPPGDYQFRVYMASGAFNVNYRGSSVAGFNGDKAIYGESPIQQLRGYYELAHRIFYAPDQGARKRWNGSAWVDASAKRWNGSAWVAATIHRVTA